MNFEYLVLNKKRERVRGEIRAANMEGAAKKLERDGHTIISVKPWTPINPKGGFQLRVELFIEKLKNHVPQTNIVFFTRQLATMFSAGMTVERSFELLAEGEKNANFKKILGQTLRDLKKGSSLSEALSKHPVAFAGLYVALVKSGEIGGALGTILDRLADHLEKSEDVRRKVVSALMYPLVVFGILIASVLILVLKIAPRFKEVYDSFGAELPGPTLIVMGTSEWMIRNFGNLSFSILVALTGAFLFFATDTGRKIRDDLKLRIPVFGPLVKEALMVHFSRTLSLLMSSSVPVLEALTLVGKAATNAVIEKGVATVKSLVQKGESVSRSMREAAIFPSLLVQLVATGEETGEIDKMLEKGAEFYEKQVDAFIGRLTSVIEPLLIIFMAVVVGTLVICIWLPIFNLGLAIRKGLN